MSKILVAYSTNAGSTAEVADAVAQELIQNGHTAEVKPIDSIGELGMYDSVVVGAPMIFGWQNTARKFVKKYQAELKGKKIAYFACAMRLTKVPGEALPPISLVLDENLASPPEQPGKLNIKERFSTRGYYLNPMVKAASSVKPVSVAFLKGKMEMYRLKWWQAAFVMVVVQAPAGDYRDWDFIKAWSKKISPLL